MEKYYTNAYNEIIGVGNWIVQNGKLIIKDKTTYDSKKLNDSINKFKLIFYKENKITELKALKQEANKTVQTNHGVFNGGRDSANKIDENYRLGLMAGESSWQIVDTTGNIVTVNEEQIKEIILQIATATRNNFFKFTTLVAQVEAATTQDELDAITWDNE